MSHLELPDMSEVIGICFGDIPEMNLGPDVDANTYVDPALQVAMAVSPQQEGESYSEYISRVTREDGEKADAKQAAFEAERRARLAELREQQGNNEGQMTMLPAGERVSKHATRLLGSFGLRTAFRLGTA